MIYHFNCILMLFLSMFLMSCESYGPGELISPNYDHLIGKIFSQSFFKGRQAFSIIEESEAIQVFQDRSRANGCLLTFGVSRADDVIRFWRIDSGPDTCKVLTRTSHLNQ